MEVLLLNKNKERINIWKDKLERLGYEVLTLDDIEIITDITDPLELIKYYYKKTGKVSFIESDNLIAVHYATSNREAKTFEDEDAKNKYVENLLYKVDHMTDYNFDILLDRIISATRSISNDELKDKLSKIKESCICIGNGGSKSACEFSKNILATKNKAFSTWLDSRSVLYEPNVEIAKNILAITYSNNNHGINEALNYARSFGINTHILTNNEKENGLDNLIHYGSDIEKEYSFISIASTLMSMAVMLKYYLDVTDNELEHLITKIYESSPNITCLDNFAKNNIDVVEIMTGDYSRASSINLESIFKESGLGIPIINEKYDYHHGPSTLSHQHPGNILIYLGECATPTNFEQFQLAKLSREYKSIIEIYPEENDPIVRQFELTMKSMFLSKSISEIVEKDLAKVDYSPVVKKLYNYKGEL